MHSSKPTLSRRLPTAVAVAAAALLALPASGMAAETFGSRLINPPNTGACGMLVAPCTYVSYIHPSAPNGDPDSSGAPNDGVITKFRIRAYGPAGVGSPASVTFRLASITRNDPDSASSSAVGTGPTVTVAGSGEIEEFAGRLPVKKGNHLAIDTSDANAIYASSGEKFTYVYSPSLIDGAAARNSDAVIDELLVAAVVEPDADKDGFGDETQDRCLGQIDVQGGCPPPDTTDPRLTGLALSKPAFKASSKLRYRLSEKATVRLKVQRIKRGRKVVTLPGRIVHNGVAGLNRRTLKARIGGRKLKPGRYRLVATARDAAGNVSTVKRLRFRIKQ
jgi:hypothetical protein